MKDRGGVTYLSIPVGQTRKLMRNLVTGGVSLRVVLVRETRSVTRAARPDGVSGRQWVRLRKARQRARKASSNVHPSLQF